LDVIFDAVDERVRARDLFAAVAAIDQVVLPKQMTNGERNSLRGTLDKLIQRRKTKAD
jgi:hypothetical protein